MAISYTQQLLAIVICYIPRVYLRYTTARHFDLPMQWDRNILNCVITTCSFCAYLSNKTVELQQIFDSIGYSLEFWYSDSIHLHSVFVYMHEIYVIYGKNYHFWCK